jgi:ATP-dependent helicase/nuclease subunit A
MDLSDKLLMTANVSCPGKWILQTAMRRTEAGEFHNLGGHPDCCSVSQIPWLIRTVSIRFADADASDICTVKESVNPAVVKKIGKYLDFRYGYADAVEAPSKLTATQLKGRSKDQEISQNTKQSSLVLKAKALQIFRKDFRSLAITRVK